MVKGLPRGRSAAAGTIPAPTTRRPRETGGGGQRVTLRRPRVRRERRRRRGGVAARGLCPAPAPMRTARDAEKSTSHSRVWKRHRPAQQSRRTAQIVSFSTPEGNRTRTTALDPQGRALMRLQQVGRTGRAQKMQVRPSGSGLRLKPRWFLDRRRWGWRRRARRYRAGRAGRDPLQRFLASGQRRDGCGALPSVCWPRSDSGGAGGLPGDGGAAAASWSTGSRSLFGGGGTVAAKGVAERKRRAARASTRQRSGRGAASGSGSGSGSRSAPLASVLEAALATRMGAASGMAQRTRQAGHRPSRLRRALRRLAARTLTKCP